MKKTTKLLFLLCLVSLTASHAQTVDSVICNMGAYYGQVTSLFQLDDGNVVASSILQEYVGPNGLSNPVPVGTVLHKMTKNGSIVTDSAVFRYNQLPTQYIFKDPNGDKNILAELGNSDDMTHGFFRIRHFDDDLVFDSLNDFCITLHDKAISSFFPGTLLNPYGDLVLTYCTYDGNRIDSVYFALVSLDGSIKQRKRFAEEEMPFFNHSFGPRLFSQSPLRYYCWGTCRNATPITNVSLQCFVLDSLFEMERHYVINENLPYLHFHHWWREKFLSLNGEEFVIACGYDTWKDEEGILLRKYDKDSNLLKEVLLPNGQGQAIQPMPVGLERGNDGSIFLAYITPFPFLENQIVVMKMDENLETIWQRYCLGDIHRQMELGQMIVLDDNSVAIAAGTRDPDPYSLVYLIVHDDYDAIEEQGMAVRPYAYWPNPAQDELHLQYSPDVTPRSIELYDLQGRLVRSQRNGLESLDLQGLAPGTYTMRVTLENGKAFSDKVVKE